MTSLADSMSYIDEIKNDPENLITEAIIKGAIEVHKNLGPGLLESVYEECLFYELTALNLKVERQKTIPLTYKNINLCSNYRLDLLVGEKIIVEVKAVNEILPLHTAQVLSYLKLSGCRLGLLINFNTELVSRGVRRVIL